MRNDDRPAGRAFTRRDLVKLFGVSGAAASARTGALPEPADSTLALQNCIAQPQQTEAPTSSTKCCSAPTCASIHAPVVSASACRSSCGSLCRA